MTGRLASHMSGTARPRPRASAALRAARSISYMDLLAAMAEKPQRRRSARIRTLRRGGLVNAGRLHVHLRREMCYCPCERCWSAIGVAAE